MANHQIQKFEAREDFQAAAKVSGVPANAIPGVLYFSRDVEVLVHAGDVVEMMPGGFFVSRPGAHRAQRLVHSEKNAILIRSKCEQIS